MSNNNHKYQYRNNMKILIIPENLQSSFDQIFRFFKRRMYLGSIYTQNVKFWIKKELLSLNMEY